MKRILALLLAILLLGAAGVAEENVYEKYDALLSLLEAGDADGARQEFDRILAGMEPAAEPEAEAIEADAAGELLRLGETLRGAGLSITFREGGVTEGKALFSVHGSPYRLTARQENSSVVYAFGEISGLGKLSGELANHLCCEFVVNGEAVSGSFSTEKMAYGEMGYAMKDQDRQAFWMYATVHNDRLQDVKTLTLRVGFRESYTYEDSVTPLNAETSDDLFEIDLLAEPAEAGGEEEAADAPAAYTDKATVKAAQAALNALGYDCGTPDGVAGKKTAAAISSAQRDFSLTETGTLTRELLDKLGVALP